MEPQYQDANRKRLTKLYSYLEKFRNHDLTRKIQYTKHIRAINNLRQQIIDLHRNPPNQRKLRIQIQFSELRKINFILRQYRRCVSQNFNKFRFKIIDRRIKPLNFYQKIQIQYFLSQRVKLPLSKTKTKLFEYMKARHDTPIFQEKDDSQTLSSQSIEQRDDNFDIQSQDNQSINSDFTQQLYFQNRMSNQLEQMGQMQPPRQRTIEREGETQTERETERERERERGKERERGRERERLNRNQSCQKSSNIRKKQNKFKNRPLLSLGLKKQKTLSLQKISQQSSGRQSSSVIYSLGKQSLQLQIIDDQQSRTQEIVIRNQENVIKDQNKQFQIKHNMFRSAFR